MRKEYIERGCVAADYDKKGEWTFFKHGGWEARVAQNLLTVWSSSDAPLRNL